MSFLAISRKRVRITHSRSDPIQPNRTQPNPTLPNSQVVPKREQLCAQLNIVWSFSWFGLKFFSL